MVEKIRVSLWDIFTFFATGLLAALVALALLIYRGGLGLKDVVQVAVTVPATIALVAVPIILTLIGMLIEPLANYFDRYLMRHVLKVTARRLLVATFEESILKDEIRKSYLGSLSGKLDNPFHLCKDYVEYKQLSTTFMVFLARFGFYRNCAFIFIAAGVVAAWLSLSVAGGVLVLVLNLAVAIVFRTLAAEFYSYQAPAIYRAFLIDKLCWVPTKDGVP